MREQLEQRLKQLKAEYEAGQRMLIDLDTKQASVRETILRISGAIQVLEEELGKTAPPNGVSYVAASRESDGSGGSTNS